MEMWKLTRGMGWRKMTRGWMWGALYIASLCKVHSRVYKSRDQGRGLGWNISLGGAHEGFEKPWFWIRSERQWVLRRQVRTSAEWVLWLSNWRPNEEVLSKEREGWWSRRMSAHLFLPKHQNHNKLLNNRQQEDAGTYQKKIPHFQR